MRTSEQINEIAAALAAAQGRNDRFAEADLIHKLYPPNLHRAKYKTLLERFFSKIVFGTSECWYWVGSRHHLGYGILNGDKAHRVSWRLHHGEIPNGLHVLHRCDVRCCVNPDHLFLGTQTDNMRDMWAKGRGHVPDINGEKNPQSRLTAAMVEEMRRLRAATGIAYHRLAKMFGVTTMTAHRAATGHSWKSVKGKE